MSQDDLKRRVAQAAVNKILPILHPQAIIGVGTGSTANFFIDILAEYYDRFYGAVSSSDASAKRLLSKSIKVCSPSCCVLSNLHNLDGISCEIYLRCLGFESGRST